MAADLRNMKRRCLIIVVIVTIMILAYSQFDWTNTSNVVENVKPKEDILEKTRHLFLAKDLAKNFEQSLESSAKSSSNILINSNSGSESNSKSGSESKSELVLSSRSLATESVSESGPSTPSGPSSTVLSSRNILAGSVAQSRPTPLPSTASNLITTATKSNEISADINSNSSVPEINCDKLALGDSWETLKAERIQMNYSKFVSKPEQFLKSVADCSQFKQRRGYLSHPVSKSEEEFPLAFSILIFRDIEQFEMLLRAIYRSQNYYCIHVDNKSSPVFKSAVTALTHCFENVFLSPRSYEVKWGEFSIVEPELECMKELLKYKKWKYFINLTGQEFPLKTNWQIVEILKIFKGANNLEGTVVRRNKDRTHPTRPKPPVNVTLTKGSVHITASRAFIEYLIHDERSILFRDWVKDTYVSDETYFTSLSHSPQLEVPGAYLGVPETDTNKNLFITRFKNWGDGPFNYPCGGKRVRQVCVLGTKDLPLLYTRPEIFANKFYIDYEPLALKCVEKRLHDFVKSELEIGRTFIDSNFYSDLDFVKNHLIVKSKPS